MVGPMHVITATSLFRIVCATRNLNVLHIFYLFIFKEKGILFSIHFIRNQNPSLGEKLVTFFYFKKIIEPNNKLVRLKKKQNNLLSMTKCSTKPSHITNALLM